MSESFTIPDTCTLDVLTATLAGVADVPMSVAWRSGLPYTLVYWADGNVMTLYTAGEDLPGLSDRDLVVCEPSLRAVAVAMRTAIERNVRTEWALYVAREREEGTS